MFTDFQWFSIGFPMIVQWFPMVEVPGLGSALLQEFVMVSDHNGEIYRSRLRLRSAPVRGCPSYCGRTSGTKSTYGARRASDAWAPPLIPAAEPLVEVDSDHGL